jgi:hypothetical protein
LFEPPPPPQPAAPIRSSITKALIRIVHLNGKPPARPLG